MSARGNTEATGKLADLLALLSLFILIALPFAARILQGRSALSLPLTHDIGYQWIPFRAFMASAFDQGVLPLWADQVFAGFPFAAFSHTGVFYLPALLLNLTDYAQAVNFFYPLHLVIAAFGVYALSRRLGLRPLAAFLAAGSYTFTGKPFYFIHFLPSVCSNVWVPWFLFAALSFLQRGRLRHFALAGIFLALQILGGDVESTAYALFFSCPALVLFSPSAPDRWRRLFALLFIFLLAGLLSSIQLFPLLTYSHHFARNQGVTFAYFSQRRLPWSILWAVLAPIKSATAENGPVLDAPYFYLGVITLGLAGFAALRKAAASSRGFAVLALAALAWSCGSIPLLDRLQFLLPLFDSFGSPEHAFFMGQLFIALLAGQGLQALSDRGEANLARSAIGVLLFGLLAILLAAGRSELLSPALLTLALFAITAFLLWLLQRFRPGRVRAFALAAIMGLQLYDLYGLAFRYLPATDPKIYFPPSWLPPLAGKIRSTGLRYIMTSREGLSDPDLLYHAGLRHDFDEVDGWITTPPRRFVELLALADPRTASFADGKLDHLGLNVDLRDGRFIDAKAMPILDLVSLGFVIDRGMPLKFSSPLYLSYVPPEYHRRTAVGGAAATMEPPARGYRTPWLDDLFAGVNEVYRYRVFINPGDELSFTASAFHADVAKGPAEVSFRILARRGEKTDVILEEKLRSEEENPLENVLKPWAIELSPLAGQEVALEIETRGPADRPDIYFWMLPWIVNPAKAFQLRDRPAPQILVYQNQEALPRAFLVHEAEVVADDQALLKKLSSASRAELARKVFLKRMPAAAVSAEVPPVGAREAAVQVRRRPGEEVYEVNAAAAGWLFISAQYYPGWRAQVEGREVPILEADYCFRAVPVAAGYSSVILKYAPWDFRVGLLATLTSWLWLAILAISVRAITKSRLVEPAPVSSTPIS